MNQAPKSSFITAIAWISIVLGAIGALIGGLMTLAFFVLFPGDRLKESLAELQARGEVDPIMAQAMGSFDVFVMVVFVFSLVTVVLSIGLLLRRHWGRIGFIGLMIATIAGNLAGLALSVAWLETNPLIQEAGLGAVTGVAHAINALMTLAVCVLSGWLAWKLNTPEIRAEFE